MQNKLVKSWGPYGAGTVVADNAAEAKAIPGAVHVNPDRFAKLHESGHLARAEPSRPIPAEVKTGSEPIRFQELPAEPSEKFFEDLRRSANAEIAQHGPSGKPIAPAILDKGGHNDPPVTPRPDSRPTGQGGKADKEP